MDKKILAVTAGDPCGIGPEIVIKALKEESIYRSCIPVVIGDEESLKRTIQMLNADCRLCEVKKGAREFHRASPRDIYFIQAGKKRTEPWKMGEISRDAGTAAFLSVETGIRMAMKGEADAVVTGPISKEAINLAGYHYSGHTEIFSAYTDTKEYGMLLVSRRLKVIHVTTHMAMKDVSAAITAEKVLSTIRLAQRAARLVGDERTIAIAGFNAHCSENGLFGNEEKNAIIPAISRARDEGICVEGPVPPDTVFVKAAAGQYGIVVAMYHDQGHIPVKMDGFHMNSKTGEFETVSGINCTVGLPVIRTSVDHGTAFDRAGKGIANENSMVDAIKMAVLMAEKRDEEGKHGQDGGHC